MPLDVDLFYFEGRLTFVFWPQDTLSLSLANPDSA